MADALSLMFGGQEMRPTPVQDAQSGGSALDLMFGQQKAPQPTAADTGINWNMPDADIRAAIKSLPKEAQKVARDEWAKRRVASERASTPGPIQTLKDVGRNFARGTPVGSWIDEGLALGRSAMGGDYADEVALERARNQATDDASTKLGTLPIIGDVTAGGLTKLAGGILSAPFSPAVRVMQGATMLPRVLNAGATGATYGAAYGAGEGEGTGERAVNALAGGGIGLGVGVAAPLVASGIGNAVGGVRSALTRTPPELQQYDRGAVNRVARAAGDDNLFNTPLGFPSNYQAEAARLGNPGMLADMGENLRGQLGAIANSPGRGQTFATQALTERRDGAAGRITREVNQSLGFPVNVPASIEATRQAANQVAGPLYRQFYQTRITPTNQLTDLLQRVPQSVFAEARQMAAARGIPIRTHRTQGIDAAELDFIKRGLDDLAGKARNAGERTAEETWSGLARAIRNEVDTILSPNDPAQSVWARARQASGEGLRFEDAAEMGQQAFRKTLTPDQMQAEMQGLSLHQLDAYRVGARDAIRTTMGNASTAYGPTGDTAARRQLQSQFGQEKLGMVAQSPRDAQRLVNRLDVETTFAETEDAVLRNSATARRLAAQQEFPGPVNSNVISREVGQRNLAGLALEGAYRIGNLVTAGAMNERRARIAENAAQMLVAQGMTRDQIARGLQQYMQNRRLNRQQVQAIETVVNRLIEGARAPTIEAAVGQ